MKIIRWLSFIPFLGFIVGALFTNKVNPYVFGMPFFHFWIVLWSLITTVILAIIYKIDPANQKGDSR
ncbi:DUF3311 domain-containing protein [Bacillus tropicus]|uniref:DUF3311 domain-containing protein n=1 Tax=Bacillus TaxID=1386 RepID=UPI0008FE00C0|nr:MULTISPECIES: DUF3311 domain-containing protein [Bacillus]MDF9558513.1 DUF3311 domain-containing protein [Bacillus tropicus]MDF9590070.1 DUF3311 domain-containing protein [Bacillus tropicus]MDF9648904.1 DUF3311 domain-containing protein [Bacillus tropicus]OJD69639.1 hypothetical protein BAU26_26570 [Bacillus sp. N35-10-4]HDR7800180.1 DUF3311 domain-containing protein [Bacillus tropicus]